MPDIVVCLPTTKVPHVPSLTKAGMCGHEVYVSAMLYPTLPQDVSFLCIDCAELTPGFDPHIEIPEIAVLEARRWWADRRKES